MRHQRRNTTTPQPSLETPALFMAGVQALHDRFGKLEFSSLFDPAIWIAEKGVPFSPLVEVWLKQAGPFVTRLPEAKRVFTKENGEFYKAGELFRQPDLAETLKKTASGGSTRNRDAEQTGLACHRSHFDVLLRQFAYVDG